MKEQTFRDTSGSMKISEDVIYKVTEKAALEVDGVCAIADSDFNLKNLFLQGSSDVPPAIKVALSGGSATISVGIIVLYGKKVNDIASRVQTSVKEAVQNMTGILVANVNVTISDVAFSEE